MNAALRYIDTYRHHDDTGCDCLPDWYIRRVMGEPKSGPKAVQQASLSAIALENDREASRD